MTKRSKLYFRFKKIFKLIVLGTISEYPVIDGVYPIKLSNGKFCYIFDDKGMIYGTTKSIYEKTSI